MSNDSVYDGLDGARAPTNFQPRLAVGKHKLVLKQFGVKLSAKDRTPRIEAEFIVVESSVHQPGEVRGFAWFVGQSGFHGEFEKERCARFIETVGKGIGDNSPVKALGAALDSPTQNGRGIQVRCDIVYQYEKDGTTPKKGRTGDPYTNATWSPVEGQTAEAVGALRGKIERGEIEAPKVAAPAAEASVPNQPLATSLLGGLGGLGK